MFVKRSFTFKFYVKVWSCNRPLTVKYVFTKKKRCACVRYSVGKNMADTYVVCSMASLISPHRHNNEGSAVNFIKKQ